MLTYKTELTQSPLLPPYLPKDSAADCLFFDIETTGFSPDTSSLYLIGAVYRKQQHWEAIQWLAEKPQEESALLRVFAAFSRPYHVLIHFNGQRFDLPYLREKYEQYQIPVPSLLEIPDETLPGTSELLPAHDVEYSSSISLKQPSAQEVKRSSHGSPEQLTASEADCPSAPAQNAERMPCSVDLYQDFRPLRRLLNLSHMNQKALEKYLGCQREDKFNGGELIQVYKNFCKAPDASALDALLLHNLDDLRGMFLITRFYAYLQLQQTPISDPAQVVIQEGVSPDVSQNISQNISQNVSQNMSQTMSRNVSQNMPQNMSQTMSRNISLTAPHNASQDETVSPDGSQKTSPDAPYILEFLFHLPEPLPAPFSHETELSVLYVEGSSARLSVRMFRGRLKHYFKDWKEYDYLPLEDQAIHRSVASFVDPAYRQKATAATCYIPKEGMFLPQTAASAFREPAFLKDRKDRISYFEMPPLPPADDFKINYLSYLLAQHFMR